MDDKEIRGINDEGGENPKKKKRGWKKGLIIALVLIVTNVCTFFIGAKASMLVSGIGTNNYAVAKSLSGISDVSKFKKLFDVRDMIYKLYDGDIDEDKLVEGAIKGMTNSLDDPYTVFMNSDEFSSFNEKNEGSYVGVGIQVAAKDDKIIVISVFENSPAEASGIKPGDVIEKVGDTEVTGSDIDKAISLMKEGDKGEKFSLTLQREGSGELTVETTRDTILMQTVSGEMLERNIGYITISMFDEHTGENFKSKLQELKDDGAKGLILDLRDNPGGLLSQSIEVVSNFVDEGKTITYTVDKYDKETDYNSKGGIAIGMPLVVLTNGNTASASEIVSGAIRDYGVGTLIGTTTFGKGIVQTVVDTGDGTGLKVTVSKYYTPDGENIHKTGINPDIEVEIPQDLQTSGFTRNEDPQFNKALEVIKDKMK